MKKQLLSNALGVTSGMEWGVWGFRWRESVAKPLVLIRTTIFFFLPQSLKRASRDPKILRAEKFRVGGSAPFQYWELNPKFLCMRSSTEHFF